MRSTWLAVVLLLAIVVLIATAPPTWVTWQIALYGALCAALGVCAGVAWVGWRSGR